MLTLQDAFTLTSRRTFRDIRRNVRSAQVVLEQSFKVAWTDHALEQMFLLFLAVASLIARAHFSEPVARGMVQSIRRQERPSAHVSVVRELNHVHELEQNFLDGGGHHSGVARLLRYWHTTNSPLGFSGLFQRHDAFATRLTLVIFGEVAEFMKTEERESIAAELARRMMPRLLGFADVLSHSFRTSPLWGQATAALDAAIEPLTGPARGRIASPLPLSSPEPEAPIIAARYVVRHRNGNGMRVLDAGREIHVAPEGPIQALRRMYRHLRLRWYPVAASIEFVDVQALDVTLFPNLRRHYTVVSQSGAPEYFPLVARNRAEALERLKTDINKSAATLHERPLYISGRKPRPPVRLGFDHLALSTT